MAGKMRRFLTLLIFTTITVLTLSACKNKGESSTADDDTSVQADSDNGIDEEADEEPETPGAHEIVFVQKDYFYSEDTDIEITGGSPCDIYYTLDGTEPDKKGTPYNNGITLVAGDEVKAYCIKAKGYFEDGSESESIVHTYFVGRDVRNRFDTLVLSVTTDPYNLYDYEYGIFVEGKLRDDHIKANPYDKIEPNDPANYNMRGRESEREVYLEILKPDGTRIAGQKAGIRTYGGWSRANLQKSIKIYARKEYDEVNNKLRYEFFPTKTAANGDGTIIDSFKRLVLRNCGNDNGFGFIRDELFQTLAGRAGYMDYEAVRPAALFVNGDYRGHFWLHEVYSDEYFEEHYGKYDGAFEILEGGELYKVLDDDGTNDSAVNDYDEAYSYAYKDLTDEKTYQELCELIDVENYLSYYALQIYIGNEDWPHNNYKVYRYYPAGGEQLREAPFDGKWRYLLHDLDFSFAIYGTGPWVDNIQKYIGKNGEIKRECPLFGQLLQREDCREIFIKKTLDLLNGVFASDYLGGVLDEMNASRMNEQSHMYGKNLIADWVLPDQLEGRMEEIKSYADSRSTFFLGKFREYFKLKEVYELKVMPAKGCRIMINSFETDEYFEGSYYMDYNTELSLTVPAGEEFDYWLINDEKIYTDELILSPALVKNGVAEVVCVLKDTPEDPHIIISELTSDGDKDYLMLYNPYEADIAMAGYLVTDDINKADEMLILPARTLAAGESIKILCGKNPEKLKEGWLKAEFNLKEGETVVLMRENEIVDEITIPDLEDGSRYIRNMETRDFYEVNESK